jgi:hypothetical protein
VFAHQAPEFLAIHHDALVTQCGPHTTVAVALKLVADNADPDEDLARVQRRRRWIIEG